MEKRYFISIIGTICAAMFTYFLANNLLHSKGKTTNQTLLDKAGIPGQALDANDDDQLENAKMVSEGSQYGVHYYNQIKAEQG